MVPGDTLSRSDAFVVEIRRRCEIATSALRLDMTAVILYNQGRQGLAGGHGGAADEDVGLDPRGQVTDLGWRAELSSPLVAAPNQAAVIGMKYDTQASCGYRFGTWPNEVSSRLGPSQGNRDATATETACG